LNRRRAIEKSGEVAAMSELHAILSRFNYFNHPYISATLAVSCLLVGIFVFLKDKRSPTNQAFLFMAYTLFHWFFGDALAMLNYADFNRALFMTKIALSSVPLISFSYYYFYSVQFKKGKRLVNLMLAISIVEILYTGSQTIFGSMPLFCRMSGSTGRTCRGLLTLPYSICQNIFFFLFSPVIPLSGNIKKRSSRLKNDSIRRLP
jgi:hypothetical protein